MLDYIIPLINSIVANSIVYLICKRLDRMS